MWLEVWWFHSLIYGSLENEQVWGKRGGGGYYENSLGQVEIKEFLRNPNGNVDIYISSKKKKKGFAKTQIG